MDREWGKKIHDANDIFVNTFRSLFDIKSECFFRIGQSVMNFLEMPIDVRDQLNFIDPINSRARD